VPPALTGSSAPSAFAERVCKIQIPLTDTPSLNSFTYPIPHSITLCAISLHLSIFLHFSASTVVPSPHNPVTRFPGSSQTYRRASSVLMPHVIATLPSKPHVKRSGGGCFTALQVLSRDSGPSTQERLPRCWGSRSGAAKLDIENSLSCGGNGRRHVD
jgi:hypothetical protein